MVGWRRLQKLPFSPGLSLSNAHYLMYRERPGTRKRVIATEAHLVLNTGFAFRLILH